LKKFTREGFDVDSIVGLAHDLKYRKLLRAEISREFLDPSEDFVRLFASRVYKGRLTEQVKEQFTQLFATSLNDYVRDRVDQRLQKALHDQPESAAEVSSKIEENEEAELDGIVTTEDELHLHRIIKAIVADSMDPERVVLKDTKSYCGYIFDNNVRKPIVRLHTQKNGFILQIFSPDNEAKEKIERVDAAYNFKYLIRSAAYQYDKDLKSLITGSMLESRAPDKKQNVEETTSADNEQPSITNGG